MSIHFSIFAVIAGCALVTFVPRIIPFIVIRNIRLPEVVIKWLSFIPVCIFTALIVDSFIIQGKSLPSMDWSVIAAIIPTVLTAWRTKSLSVTVIVGILCMAAIRLVF